MNNEVKKEANAESLAKIESKKLTINEAQSIETWNLDMQEEHLSRKWKKPSETMSLVNHFFNEGLTPKQVLAHILPHYSMPHMMTDEFAVQIILELFNERRSRNKLSQYNTFEQAVELFRTKKNILVLTGAGVSVSCGIPDFRSANGIYARLHKDFPELPDPQAMFDIEFFRKNPNPFYNFAKEIFPGQFKPSVSHMFIKFLEESGQLLRNYTQNIDTLEKVAGISRVVECHGSFSRSTCLNCKNQVDSEEIKADVVAQRVARCQKCMTGVMKPNIVFFGEDLGDKFHQTMGDDHDKVDLLVVIGSSLKVQPVSLIPFNVDADVPQILINREQLTRYEADIKLLGDCDDIILSLCLAIGGEIREKMRQELECRSVQFPQFVEQYRATSDLSIPRVLSIKEFKRSIEALSDGRGDEPPPNKRARHASFHNDKNKKTDMIEKGKEISDTNNLGALESSVKSDYFEKPLPSSSTPESETISIADSTTNNAVAIVEAVSYSAIIVHNAEVTTTELITNCANDGKANISTKIEETSTTKNTTLNSDDDDDVLWESNYVDVQNVLPFNSMLFISPNLSIFKGAELFYDRDSDVFCRRPGPSITRLYDDDNTTEAGPSRVLRSHVYSTSSSEDGDDNGSDSSWTDSTLSKANSLPADAKYCTRQNNHVNRVVESIADKGNFCCFNAADFEIDDDWSERASSCPVGALFPTVTVEDCEAILNETNNNTGCDVQNLENNDDIESICATKLA